MIYKFNHFTLNTDNFNLTKGTASVAVEPQVFNIILYLIENKDRVVTRQALLDTIWKGKIVSDSSISNHIKFARKILNDDGIKQQVIKTIHGRGYQFIAALEQSDKPSNIKKSKNKPLLSIKAPMAIVLVLLIGTLLYFYPYNARNGVDNRKGENQSIAVLAFKDLSPLSDQEYFSDGMSEELLNLFSKIPNLRVVSRTSSFSYKNKSPTIEKIGEELKVDYIMEGSVRKSGEELRITVQLIRISDGSHVWSETYDHTLDDIFKIQDNIALEVTKQLKIKLKINTIKTTPADPHAYTLYLQAIYLLKENTESSIKKSLYLISESISIDPNYAPTWAAYSRILYTAAIYSQKEDNSMTFMLSKQAAIKAIKIDDKFAIAYSQMTLINLAEWDMQSAQSNIDAAMKLNNSSTAIVGVAAYQLQLKGQLNKNIAMLEYGIELDPLYDIHYLNLSLVYLFLNRFDEAQEAIEKYAYFKPNAVGQHAIASHILIAMEKYDAALIEAEKEVNDFYKIGALAFATYALGDIEQADQLMQQLLLNYPHASGQIASVYAFRNDPDNAFKYLEKAYEKHDAGLLHFINFQALRKLWTDPRWDVFINKIGLEKGHWLLDKRLEG